MNLIRRVGRLEARQPRRGQAPTCADEWPAYLASLPPDELAALEAQADLELAEFWRDLHPAVPA